MVVNTASSIALIVTLLLSGYIIEAIKRIVTLLTKIILTILSIFQIKIKTKEKSLKMSDDFIKAYPGIRIVRLSNKNLKHRSSIDWMHLGLLLACLILIIVNLGAVSNNAISAFLYSLVAKFNIIQSVRDMNTVFTATIFSILSFAATKVLQRWKDTKPQRQEARATKLRYKAVNIMTTEELLFEAKKKDALKRKELE